MAEAAGPRPAPGAGQDGGPGRWWLRYGLAPPVVGWWLRHGLGPAVVRWWRRRGLRARVTMLGAAALLIAFAVADLLLFNALRVSLTRSVDDTARQGAAVVVGLINSDRLPDPVPVAGGTSIQVLDPSGQIVNASFGGDRLVPMLPPRQAVALARGGGATQLHGAPFDMPSLLRVVVLRADNGDLVLAAVPFSFASGSLSVVARAMIIGTPLVFLAFAGAIWLVVGTTLRPIDLLRRGAARVTGTGAPENLPVPEARDEVRSLALTLNDMLSRLTAAQQRQRALVSDTAHELRSPIASIRAQLEVALDHPDSQDWAETAQDVLADTLRLSRLAEDLLLLARLDEQAGAAPPGTPVDLAELAKSVTARYCEARVPVTARAEGEAAVLGDCERLDRLLVNLIDNAIRYAKSEVVVQASRSGQWAELTVTDDGPGIGAADRERAFDRFARLEAARAREGDDTSGAGLGLAIVRATAQAYNGAVHLEDASPGLRAVVRLPLNP